MFTLTGEVRIVEAALPCIRGSVGIVLMYASHNYSWKGGGMDLVKGRTKMRTTAGTTRQHLPQPRRSLVLSIIQKKGMK